jgi:hypothetical protein
MGFCELARKFVAGIDYGMRILKQDRACERTHRRMMRLHYLAGDRTAALRQYARCLDALDQELGVGPARATVHLYEQIRADRLAAPDIPCAFAPAGPPASADDTRPVFGHLLQGLAQLRAQLLLLEGDVAREISGVERAQPYGGEGALHRWQADSVTISE